MTPELRAWRRTLLPAVCLAVVSVAFGLSVGYALCLLLAGVALTVAARYALGTPAYDAAWPPPPPVDRPGGHAELDLAAWALGDGRRRVSEPALRRLRVAASSRLGRLGVDWTAPEDEVRARQLLGPRAWAVLNSPGGRLPRMSDIQHCVTVLEGLEPGGHVRPDPQPVPADPVPADPAPSPRGAHDR